MKIQQQHRPANRPQSAPHSGCRGASLLELLVTLAVAGVLMGTALPAFVELGADHRAAARINAMLGAVRATRHLAIAHNAPRHPVPRPGATMPTCEPLA